MLQRIARVMLAPVMAVGLLIALPGGAEALDGVQVKCTPDYSVGTHDSDRLCKAVGYNGQPDGEGIYLKELEIGGADPSQYLDPTGYYDCIQIWNGSLDTKKFQSGSCGSGGARLAIANPAKEIKWPDAGELAINTPCFEVWMFTFNVRLKNWPDPPMWQSWKSRICTGFDGS